MAALASPIISGIGSILGGIFGSNAASKASQQIVQGDQQAQGQLNQTEQQALGNLSPYQQSGTQANGLLSQMLGTPGQGLLSQWGSQPGQTFTAPTAAQAAQTPGYQFQLQQGEQALQNSAAAQGGLLSGRTLAGLNNYAQGVASTNYQNTFNNALTQYQQAYQSFLNNQQNTYGMLSGQQGLGLNATGQANGVLSNMGTDIAQLYSNEGAARAGGTLGSANAWSNAISGVGGAMQNLPWGKWFGGGGGSAPGPGNLPLTQLSPYASMPLMPMSAMAA